MFKEIDYKKIDFNPFTYLNEGWMLLSSGKTEKAYNTMTVSWGHFGSLWGDNWGMPTAIVYVRPQRYTKKFMDSEEYFSLSYFGNDYKKDLAYLGSHSGKEGDKVKNTSLTPVFSDNTIYFNEAKLVFICKKIYTAEITEDGFIDKTIIEDNYKNKDFHTEYIGRIVKILKSE